MSIYMMSHKGVPKSTKQIPYKGEPNDSYITVTKHSNDKDQNKNVTETTKNTRSCRLNTFDLNIQTICYELKSVLLYCSFQA